MHQTIRIIVFAEDEVEAEERAVRIIDDYFSGDGFPFDYGSVNGRPVLASSKEGKRLIKEGMKWTKADFYDNLDKVKELINFYSNEELFENEIIDPKKKILNSLGNGSNLFGKSNLGLNFFKHYCYNLGEYSGTSVWLYDNDGEGIRDNKHLKNVLDKWGEKNTKKVFVVPCNVHS